MMEKGKNSSIMEKGRNSSVMQDSNEEGDDGCVVLEGVDRSEE